MTLIYSDVFDVASGFTLNTPWVAVGSATTITAMVSSNDPQQPDIYLGWIDTPGDEFANPPIPQDSLPDTVDPPTIPNNHNRWGLRGTGIPVLGAYVRYQITVEEVTPDIRGLFATIDTEN